MEVKQEVQESTAGPSSSRTPRTSGSAKKRTIADRPKSPIVRKREGEGEVKAESPEPELDEVCIYHMPL